GIAVLCGGAIYGAIMGAFAGRAEQVFYSAVKVPLLLAASTGLALPSFFVFNTLAGLRDDFPAAMRAVIGSQGTVAIILAALAPLTLVWYASAVDYLDAIVYNAAVFAVASFSAQRTLRRAYRDLIARNQRHRIIYRIWVFLYAFVGIQMGWVLRPFIGYPGWDPSFLRPGAWSNAYVVVAQTIYRSLTQ
ncbi:MAG: hypothetical protein ACRCZF_11440, partial [Gemmataceae bacterium]